MAKNVVRSYPEGPGVLQVAGAGFIIGAITMFFVGMMIVGGISESHPHGARVVTGSAPR